MIARARPAATGLALRAEIGRLFEERLGLGSSGSDGSTGRGDEGRERDASLELILAIVSDLALSDADLTAAAVVAELDRRDAEEAAGSANGVNLLTYHRAKGLEWDAVFLPALEEGLLPIRQAKEDDEIAEERRLLYVGITRARTHLAVSWAETRDGSRRRASRFLHALQSGGAGRAVSPRIVQLPPTGERAAERAGDGPLLDALQRWRRERSKADGVPAYVVAHDAMLAAIADQRPRTIAALRRVKGMGPVKLETYGPEILAIVGSAE